MNEIEALKKDVDEARLEYLAQLAYVMDLDSIIAALNDPFSWSKICKTEEERKKAIDVYESKAAQASYLQREKLMKLEALEAKLKEFS